MQVAGHFLWQPWFIGVAGTCFGMVYVLATSMFTTTHPVLRTPWAKLGFCIVICEQINIVPELSTTPVKSLH
jgi:hypothetical protein